MTVHVPRKAVRHSPEERERIIAAGIELERSGWAGGFIPKFLKAQEILSEDRRRSHKIESTTTIQWFVDAIKAFRDSPDAARRVDHTVPHTPPPTLDSGALASKVARAKPIFWKPQEQRDLCAEAARLLMDLQVGSPHEALVMAQERVLSPDRRRAKIPPSSVAHWYPEGRLDAMEKLRSERERVAAEAELANIKEQLFAHTAPAPALAPATPVAEPAAPIPPAPAPEPVPAPPAPIPVPEMPPQTPAPAVAASVVIPGAADDIASHLVGLWKGIRERLVQEVSNVFVEGIHRGMQRITLIKPPETAEITEAAEVVPEPEPLPATTSAAPALAKVKAKPSQSVLVVGLKGDQPDHIRAEFAEKLDLRFCSSDQSKDQLRAMTSAADVTVVVTDFVSHSHEDIIKARSNRFIKSAGGITRLKQELARLEVANLNRQAHA